MAADDDNNRRIRHTQPPPSRAPPPPPPPSNPKPFSRGQVRTTTQVMTHARTAHDDDVLLTHNALRTPVSLLAACLLCRTTCVPPAHVLAGAEKGKIVVAVAEA